MKDLNAILSPLKVSGSLICTIGVFVVGAIVTGAGVSGCFEVLIFGFGAGHLGCSSSLLISSSLLSVSYLLLLGATMFLGSILNAAGLDSLSWLGLLIGCFFTSPWVVLSKLLMLLRLIP